MRTGPAPRRRPLRQLGEVGELGQLGDGQAAEEAAQRHLDAEAVGDTGGDPRRAQRCPADLIEGIIDAYRVRFGQVYVQHLTPDLQQRALGRGPRWRPPQRRQWIRLRQPGDVYLAVRGHRQRVKQHDDLRHEGFRQVHTKMTAQLRGRRHLIAGLHHVGDELGAARAGVRTHHGGGDAGISQQRRLDFS